MSWKNIRETIVCVMDRRLKLIERTKAARTMRHAVDMVTPKYCVIDNSSAATLNELFPLRLVVWKNLMDVSCSARIIKTKLRLFTQLRPLYSDPTKPNFGSGHNRVAKKDFAMRLRCDPTESQHRARSVRIASRRPSLSGYVYVSLRQTRISPTGLYTLFTLKAGL